MKTFVILCVGHSGSSMLAGAMHQMGVNMTWQPKKKDEWHPRGTWERHNFMAMNNKILSKADGSWNNPPPLENILRLVNDKDLSQEIKKLVKGNKRELWGWKDPRTCLTIPLWHPHIPDPHYIVLHRSLKAMVGSWTNPSYSSKFGEDMSKEKAEMIISDCGSRIVEFTVESFITDKELIVFQYEQILSTPRKELERLAEFIGCEVNENALNMVDKKLRHF